MQNIHLFDAHRLKGKNREQIFPQPIVIYLWNDNLNNRLKIRHLYDWDLLFFQNQFCGNHNIQFLSAQRFYQHNPNDIDYNQPTSDFPTKEIFPAGAILLCSE
jgi:hypothetical protein